jgi:hypothetical protein
MSWIQSATLRLAAAAATASLLTLVTASARAQRYRAEFPVPQPRAYVHEGVFFRLAGGGGYGSLTLPVPYSSGCFSSSCDIGFTSKSAGGALAAFEAEVGGTVSRHVVLGGGLTYYYLPKYEYDTTVRVGTTTQTTKIEADVDFVIPHLFLSMYPDPQGPLHVDLFGGASVSTGGDSEFGGHIGAGLGISTFVSRDWSVGPAVRGSYTTASTEPTAVKFAAGYVMLEFIRH